MAANKAQGETVEVARANGDVSTRSAEMAPARREASPFTSMRRMVEDMDRIFNEWSFGREWLTPFFGREPLAKRMEELGKDVYLPDIEVLEKDGAMVVRADLPGIQKEDIHVEITSNSLVIKGERRREEKEEREGYYRSERSYGSFYRSIPFRDGVEASDAQATFKDGVLEVTVKTKKNGQKIEIK